MKRIHFLPSFTACSMLLIFLTFSIEAASAQTCNATIHGNLKQMKPGTWIYSQWYDIEHMALGPEHFDSVQNTPQGFTIKMNVKPGGGNGMILFIGRKGGVGKGMFVYADQGEVLITGSDSTFNNAELSGSLFSRELNEFHHFINDNPTLSSYDAVKTKAMMAKRGKDSLAIQQTTRQLNHLDSIRKTLSLQWIDKHLNSPISVFVMQNIYEPLYNKLSFDEQEVILNKLSPAALNNKAAEAMRYTIRMGRIMSAGKKAPDFTQNDTLGRPVSLKDFRGKYVLVDFWASWCGPCRKENPNVVKTFKQFKDKGFTVLSVSLDKASARGDWLEAIHKDGLSGWTHVSDLKYWANDVAKLYDVKAVPSNFLVGPDGTIIAKDLRGEDLGKKIAELLN